MHNDATRVESDAELRDTSTDLSGSRTSTNAVGLDSAWVCVINDGGLNGSTHHEDHCARFAGGASSGVAGARRDAWRCGASGIV